MNVRLINAVTGFIVGFAAVGFAMFLFLTLELEGLNGWKRTLLCCIFILYASFRFIRSVKLLRQKHHEN